jgi:hypothetical protein
MTDVTVPSVGDFAFDEESRTLRGLLLPFGETSRPSQSGHVATFAADDIDLPRDVSVVTLNRSHDRHDPIGRATELSKTDHGVEAVFRLADTEEADTWLTQQRDKLRKLSAEVRYFADGVRARLTGAALVTEGAFASAALFALAPEAEDEDTTPEPTPAEDNPTTEMEEVTMTSIVPDDAGVATPVARTDANALFAAVASGDAEALAPFAGAGALFAIQPIQQTGPSGRTIYADTAIPQALGELWEGQAYSRRFQPLITNATLTAQTMTGWRWVSKPEVADYAGNLAEVPSNVVDTEPVTVTASRPRHRA